MSNDNIKEFIEFIRKIDFDDCDEPTNLQFDKYGDDEWEDTTNPKHVNLDNFLKGKIRTLPNKKKTCTIIILNNL